MDYFLINHKVYSDKANKILIDLHLAYYEDYTIKKLRKDFPSDKKI